MLNRKNDKPECDLESNTRRLEISSLQKAAEALRESEEKCHAIIEGIEDGYYEVDLEGNFTFSLNALFDIVRERLTRHRTENGRCKRQPESGETSLSRATFGLSALTCSA